MSATKSRELWEGMIRRSFHPSQWYLRDDDANEGITEGKVMWVYKPMQSSNVGRFEVGYWTPHKEWVQDSRGLTKEAAVLRVHFLNGGNG